jgi:profilin
MQAVVAAYKDTADPKKVWATGLHIAGQKYVTLKADDRSLYGKKVGSVQHKTYPIGLCGISPSCVTSVA